MFKCPPSFRVFAAQNPLREGGGRKGLPRSFLNRFTRVAVETMSVADLEAVRTHARRCARSSAYLRACSEACALNWLATWPNCGRKSHPRRHERSRRRLHVKTRAPVRRALCRRRTSHALLCISLLTPRSRSQVCAALHPRVPAACRAAMVAFNESLARAVVAERRFGRAGAPWEFNLRDVLRWSELAEAAVAPSLDLDAHEDAAVGAAVRALFPVVYLHRFRSADDRSAAASLFAQHFPGGEPAWPAAQPAVRLTPEAVHIGRARLARAAQRGASPPPPPAVPDLRLLHSQLPALEASAAALAQGWMVALVAPSAAGKTSVARMLAGLAGAPLHEVRAPCSARLCSASALHAAPEMTNALLHSALSDGAATSGNAEEQRILLTPDPPTTATSAATLRSLYTCSHGSHRPSQVTLTSATDTADLLGSFEQVEPGRASAAAVRRLAEAASSAASAAALAGQFDAAAVAASAWSSYEASDVGADADAALLASACAAVAAAAQAGGEAAFTAWSAAVARDAACASTRQQHTAGNAVGGAFEWMDGVLLRAMEAGHWVLLDNANLCSPTVLDRLNPLLEPAGVLLVPEAGMVGGVSRCAVPAPGFRLILGLDPRHGEASRAMRNRGIEVFILPEDTSEEKVRLAPRCASGRRKASIRQPVATSSGAAPRMSVAASLCGKRSLAGRRGARRWVSTPGARDALHTCETRRSGGAHRLLGTNLSPSGERIQCC